MVREIRLCAISLSLKSILYSSFWDHLLSGHFQDLPAPYGCISIIYHTNKLSYCFLIERISSIGKKLKRSIQELLNRGFKILS